MTAVEMSDPTPVLTAALKYARSGLEVFPCKPDKSPYTQHGWKDASSDAGQIQQWWQRWPDALVAARIPKNRVVLDIDPRHGGDRTWQELQDAYGPIESGRRHRSGRGDNGTHHWFIHPGGKLSTKRLNDWAKRNGVGSQVGTRGWSAGIDILHWDHRYSILPPSPHPDTGDPYTWDARNPPGAMPPWLVDLLTSDPPPPPPSSPVRPVRDESSIADWYSANHSWHDVLRPLGWQLVQGDGDSDGSKWRHPAASAASSASVKHGCLFVYSPNTDFEVTEPDDPRGYTRFRAYTLTQHNGDGTAAARAAYVERDGVATHRDPFGASTSTAPEPAAVFAPANLPDEWWNTRPLLATIRQAAHSRGRSADAVLLSVMARISVLYPPSVRLPPIVGGYASLNMLGAVVAGSGSGKSSSDSIAAELVPLEGPGIIADVPLGSGEGLAEMFFTWESEEGPDGKTRKVKKQTIFQAYVYLDEGQALAEMGNRKGSTLLPTLRSAWAGQVLGQSNASQETKRILPAHKYRLSIIVGFQYEYADQLLADAAGGTPQRFVFASANDPNVPDDPPDWPGPLDIPLATLTGIGGTVITFPDDIVEQIRQENRAIVRGEMHLEPLDSHRNLVRMKLAALLALAEARINVTHDDWQLATTWLDVSNVVRATVVERARQKAQELERQRLARDLQRDAALESGKYDRALRSGAKSLARRVWKHGPCRLRDLRAATSSEHRKLVDFDEMVRFAVAEQWISERDDEFVPGAREVPAA